MLMVSEVMNHGTERSETTSMVASRSQMEIGEELLRLGKMIDPEGRMKLPELMDAFERAHIVAMLARCGGNQTKAARVLGISRRKLVYRIEQFGLPRPRKDKIA